MMKLIFKKLENKDVDAVVKHKGYLYKISLKYYEDLNDNRSKIRYEERYKCCGYARHNY